MPGTGVFLNTLKVWLKGIKYIYMQQNGMVPRTEWEDIEYTVLYLKIKNTTQCAV